MAVVETDLRDGSIAGLSPERNLSCSYGAILTAARAALHASGYRVPKGNSSYRYYAIQSPRYTVEFDSAALLQIEAVQKKRNTIDYIRVSKVSDGLTAEAIPLAEEPCESIRGWLLEEHPELYSL